MSWADALRVLSVQATYVLDQPLRGLHPPAFRGAMGAAYMDLACTRPDRECAHCDRQSSCTVTTWFDPGRLGSGRPRPYALRELSVGPGGRTLTASLRVFGRVPQQDVLLGALRRVGAMGFGAKRVRGTLGQLLAVGGGESVPVVDGGQLLAPLPEPSPLTTLFLSVPQQPRLLLASPMQLGRTDAPITGADLLSSTIRRLHALAAEQGQRIDHRWPDPGAVRVIESELSWVEGSRWSRRQRARIGLGGWMGSMVLDGAEEFQELVAAAEVIQVGRNTSAGLGAIAIDRTLC